DRLSVDFSGFAAPESSARKVFHAGSRPGRSFAQERADPKANVFNAAVQHVAALRSDRRVLVAAWSEGSLDRLGQILAEHGLGGTVAVDSLRGLEDAPPQQV